MRNMVDASRKKIIAIGELLWDCLPSGPVLGGAPANFALRLAELGLQPQLVSCVGKDDLGDAALAQLKDRGLNAELVQRHQSKPTGTVEVSLDESGNASYVINEGVAYGAIEVTEPLLAHSRQADFICFGTLVQREPTSRETLYRILEEARTATKLVDINLRKSCYTKETVQTSLEVSDILKLNQDEVPLVASLVGITAATYQEFAVEVVRRFDMHACLVTRAEHGVYACNRDGEIVDLPGYDVEVADTIGSGDAFTAGFTFKYLQGASLRECCDFGNRIGAVVATKSGGMGRFDYAELGAL